MLPSQATLLRVVLHPFSNFVISQHSVKTVGRHAQTLHAAVSVAVYLSLPALQPHSRPLYHLCHKHWCNLSLLEFSEFNDAISKLNSSVLPKQLKFTGVPMKCAENLSLNETPTLNSPCSLPGMYLYKHLPRFYSSSLFLKISFTF